MSIDPRRGSRAGRLTLEEKRAVRLLVAQGLTQPEVSVRVGVSIRSVGRVVAEAGGMTPITRSAKPDGLTHADREHIFLGCQTGKSFRKIGEELGRSHTTISREVARNGGRHDYRAWRAERDTEQRARRPKPLKLETSEKLRSYVIAGIAKKWSPDEITGRLRTEFPDDMEMRVSHETIYRWLYVHCERRLKAQLIEAMRSPRPYRVPHSRSGKQSNRIFDIEQLIRNRPAEINDRVMPGHWEGDLICGTQNKSAIATLVERTTLFTVLVQTGATHDAATVRTRITEEIGGLPEQLLLSLTWDQGAEMAEHKQFSIDTGIEVYFCDPHSPWQRGLNENTNGLLRQYFPKGTDLSVHTQPWLNHVAAELNDRPRKTLGYRKPAEAFQALVH